MNLAQGHRTSTFKQGLKDAISSTGIRAQLVCSYFLKSVLFDNSEYANTKQLPLKMYEICFQD